MTLPGEAEGVGLHDDLILVGEAAASGGQVGGHDLKKSMTKWQDIKHLY